ncbi:hypothetical protein K7X08_008830 [Anisodus acutangulus]|uniref:Protein kinase domain-containing protein n=1 Tax=Anisodus acutangulus TaxID=402998 RepID=A0A9Q1N445_9SOLA|nr:hypothetical protein K7X08_008830 [Anisodus acutangulus]
MKLKKPHLCFLIFLSSVCSQSSSATDATVMQELKKAINPPSSLSWVDPDPCKWDKIQCTKDGKVTRIQIGNQGLKGSLPPNLNNLTELQVFEVQNNGLTGPLPSFAGLNLLESILLSGNGFTSIPRNFFDGMTSLQTVYLDDNPFSPWSVPDSLKSASSLQFFSAMSTNISGKIPDLFGGDTLPSLTHLHLSFNKLEGPLPLSFSGSSIQSLWLNGKDHQSRLNGSIDVVQNMTQLTELWLQDNEFTGPLPDLSGLNQLQNFSVRDNSLTGPVLDSLVNLTSLKVVNLTNNLLQGPMPKFQSSVLVDMLPDTNSFCLSKPGPCDSQVNTLLAVAKDVGYPRGFADKWKGNDPCSWMGITCDGGNITVLNFLKMGLTGTISPSYSSITSLQKLILANNFLTGIIPNELASLPNLRELDVSNNQLYGKIPPFKSHVLVKTEGNVNIGKDNPPPPAPGTPSGSTPSSPNGDGGGRTHGNGGGRTHGNGGKKSSTGVVVGSVIGGICGAVVAAGLFVFCLYRTKRKRSGRVQSPHTVVIHPHHSESDQDAVKITVAGSSVNGGTTETYSCGSSAPGDLHIIEAGNMVISIQVLRNVTNNFSQENILGRGGFGTVYKGELHDGAKIAVKRMESGVMSEKGLDEFKSEIAPLNILLGDDMRAKVADFGLVRLAPDGKHSLVTRLAGTFGYLAPEYAVTGRVTTKIDVFSFGVILMELITGRKALDESQPEESMHLVPWFRRMHINKETFRKAIDTTIDLDEDTLASVSIVAELAGHCCVREPHQRPDMGHAVNVLSSLAELWKPAEVDEDEIYGIDYDMTLPQAVKKWQALEGMSGIDSSSSYIGSSENTQTSIPTRPSGFADSFTSVDGR